MTPPQSHTTVRQRWLDGSSFCAWRMCAINGHQFDGPPIYKHQQKQRYRNNMCNQIALAMYLFKSFIITIIFSPAKIIFSPACQIDFPTCQNNFSTCQNIFPTCLGEPSRQIFGKSWEFGPRRRGGV